MNNFKNIAAIVALLIFGNSFAQQQRFIYEYKYAPDSLARDKQNAVLMYLDISAKGSKYYDRQTFVADSTMNAIIEKATATGSHDINLGNLKEGKIKYIVEKFYPSYKVLFYNTIGADNYKVEDSAPFSWKILPEKAKIGEFMCQKATTERFGRKWTAWFTTEIPLQDGPYKFHGLPGLIVKIEDFTNSQIIELKSSQKINTDWTDVEKDKNKTQFISVDLQKYKKILLENRLDPTKSMRNLQQGASFEIRDSSGNVIDNNKYMRDIEARQKEANKHNNNPLELWLFK